MINCYTRWNELNYIITVLESQTIAPSEIHRLFNTEPSLILLNKLEAYQLVKKIVIS